MHHLKDAVIVKQINWLFWKRDYLLDYKELKWVGESIALCYRGRAAGNCEEQVISQVGQEEST